MLKNVQPGHLNNKDMRSANTFLLAFLGDPFLLDAASVGTRRWMRGLRMQAETLPLQPLTRSVSVKVAATC